MPAGSRSHKSGAPYLCPRGCGARLLRQSVGHRCALDVTADLRPLTPAEQAQARGPNRLIWCLHESRWSGAQLRWIHPWHPADCPRAHVADHQCPGGPQSALF